MLDRSEGEKSGFLAEFALIHQPQNFVSEVVLDDEFDHLLVLGEEAEGFDELQLLVEVDVEAQEVEDDFGGFGDSFKVLVVVGLADREHEEAERAEDVVVVPELVGEGLEGAEQLFVVYELLGEVWVLEDQV